MTDAGNIISIYLLIRYKVLRLYYLQLIEKLLPHFYIAGTFERKLTDMKMKFKMMAAAMLVITLSGYAQSGGSMTIGEGTFDPPSDVSARGT